MALLQILIKISWWNKEDCNALDSVLPKFMSFLKRQDVIFLEIVLLQM